MPVATEQQVDAAMQILKAALAEHWSAPQSDWGGVSFDGELTDDEMRSIVRKILAVAVTQQQ